MTRSCANHMIITRLTRATGCHVQPFRFTEHGLHTKGVQKITATIHETRTSNKPTDQLSHLRCPKHQLHHHPVFHHQWPDQHHRFTGVGAQLTLGGHQIYQTANSITRSADPENPGLEPNIEWIGCTVCEMFAFKPYCDLETGVRCHSRSSKVALFDKANTTLYSSSIVNMPLYVTVSEIKPHIDRKSLTLCIC